MRLLGIDYGRKRVGLALSDETNTIATPLTVIPNDRELTARIKELIKERDVGGIVIGTSHDYHGKDNPVMKEIKMFSTLLEQAARVPIYGESETLTSVQASRHETKRWLRDASAAALILQSYLDKLREGHAGSTYT